LITDRKQPRGSSLETKQGCLHFSNGNLFDISVTCSMKLRSPVQYFFVLRSSVFLHFSCITINLIKVVSPWVEMCIKG
ncbi:hypothetical protein T10_1933, partial [Trichinella papuae]